MHYTEVLFSEADHRFYIGARRIGRYAAGRAESAAYRRPLRLVYDEACLSPDDTPIGVNAT